MTVDQSDVSLMNKMTKEIDRILKDSSTWWLQAFGKKEICEKERKCSRLVENFDIN